MSRAATQREREEFYEQSEALTPLLGASTSGGVFIVRTRDKDVGRSLFVKQGRGEMNVLARSVKTLEALFGERAVVGRDFIDIGANIGTTTIPALLNHGFTNALALEPEEENFATLRINAILNKLDDRIICLSQAASNRAGSAELAVNPARGGKHHIVPRKRRFRLRPNQELVEVETTTLDRLAGEGRFDPDRTGMLWIDAQAHEGHIVEGARCLTSRGVPILLEWDPVALDKLGDRTKLHTIAEREYSHFAGMRADPAEDGPSLWIRPVRELHEYAQRFLDRASGQRLTDLLLLRLGDRELPTTEREGEIDLSAILKEHATRRPAVTRRGWRG